MPKIIITDDRHSKIVPVMHNGVLTKIPVGEEVDVSDEAVDALTNSSISFAMVEEGGSPAPGVAAELPPTPAPKTPRPKRAKKK